MVDCYYHGYSGGPGGPCNRCERENGELAGYYKSKAENAKYGGSDKKEAK